MSDPVPSERRAAVAATAVRLASLWIAAGALFKLFAGSPNDLPRTVVELFRGVGLGPVQGFRLAIAVELVVVILALARPGIGWLPEALLLAVFASVLVPLASAGAASCGCFGSAVTIPPAVMIGIDGALLLLVLATRPWSSLARRSLRPLPLIPLVVVAVAAPWLQFRTISDGPPRRAERSRAAAPEGDEPAEEPAVREETAPATLPDFHWFEPEDWIGRDLGDTDLARFLDVEQLPLDCRVIFYRQTCDVCREHLEELSIEPPPVSLVLVRVAEKGDSPETELTRIKPPAMELELPALERGYGLSTPLQMDVSNWIVESVVDLHDE